jgi:hypothetical protein
MSVRGTQNILRNLKNIKDKRKKAELFARLDVADKILELAEVFVPVITGALKRSSGTQVVQDNVRAGYGVEYAFVTHIRRGEWLATTIKQNKNRLTEGYAKRVQQRLLND